MFEFPREVVNRDGFKFIAVEKEWKFIYKTTDLEEIKVLINNWFKDLTPKKIKNESNKKKN